MIKKIVQKAFEKLSDKIFNPVNGPNDLAETFLLVAQEPHLSEHDWECYAVTTRTSLKKIPNLMPQCALTLMEYLLDGYTVFTHLSVQNDKNGPMQTGVQFIADYAESADNKPSNGEKVYTNGSDKLISITKGINKKLVERIGCASETDYPVLYLQSAFKEISDQNDIVDYQSAYDFLNSGHDIWTKYSGFGREVLIGIWTKKITEAQLVDKLIAFAKLYGTKIDFGWPEALAVAQATDASVLANRISFKQESVRKKQ